VQDFVRELWKLTELLILEVLVLEITISDVASEKRKHDSSVIFGNSSSFPVSRLSLQCVQEKLEPYAFYDKMAKSQPI